MKINITGPIYEGAYNDFDAIASQAKSGESIDVFVNSPGGDAFEAISIYNAMKLYRKNGVEVNLKLVGMAASASTIIMCGASNVEVGTGTVMMIHNPASPIFLEMMDEQRVDRLKNGLVAVKEAIVDIYEEKTNLSRDEILAMMAAETYLNTDKIVELGFASGVFDYEEPEEKEEEKQEESKMDEDQIKALVSGIVTQVTDSFKSEIASLEAKVDEKITAVSTTVNNQIQQQHQNRITSARNSINALCEKGVITPALRDNFNKSEDAEFLENIAASYANNAGNGNNGESVPFARGNSVPSNLRAFTKPPGAEENARAIAGEELEFLNNVASAFQNGPDKFRQAVQNGEIKSRVFGG